MKVLITTIPFGKEDISPLEKLKNQKLVPILNPLGRKMKEQEIIKFAKDCEAIIAGTDPLTKKVIDKLPNLKIISRVGAGLDSVDLKACKKRDIKVTFTPDAPTEAVSELTLGLIFSLLRSIHISNGNLREGKWEKYIGKNLNDVAFGIIGFGRIGKSLHSKLKKIGAKNFLIHDDFEKEKCKDKTIKFTSKNILLKESDLISIHIPLTKKTKGYLGKKELTSMKKNDFLINTARGGIINEKDLLSTLKKGYFSGVALDVFELEPYQGPLIKVERCLLTSHLGPMTSSCRKLMENQAADEICRFFNKKKLKYLAIDEF